MKDLDQIQAENPGQGFQFPGVFEITAMGASGAGLEENVPRILESIGLSVLAGSVRTRPSREGNFVSVTLGFTCPTRAKYDEAHAALRADPDIRWTL
jgi:putative lipoic acid-binding regulatory protein